ncbi:MAG TPA: hypothetical protein VG838_16805 [Opitutaceae bacterium]|nr:hypothetical protein [Opitutaceae bacterium]
MSFRRPNEKFLLGHALAALVLASSWAGWRENRLAGAAGPVPGRDPVGAATYRLAEFDAVPPARFAWTEPKAQSHGPEWIYDLFTPPPIYYHPENGEFSAGLGRATPTAEPDDFGLELVGVRHEPFRLQLVGFVGGEGNYLGAFENRVTGEHFLARGGKELPELGLTVVDLAVTRRGTGGTDGMVYSERVATAVVRDLETGEEVTLSSRECSYTGPLLATLAAADLPGGRADLHRGDVLRRGDASYRIREVRLEPPAADVARELPETPLTEARTLTLRL